MQLDNCTLQISQCNRSIPHCLDVSFDSNDSIEFIESDSVEKSPIVIAKKSRGIFITSKKYKIPCFDYICCN